MPADSTPWLKTTPLVLFSVGPTQISWEHIYAADIWDVQMETRKHDIKSPASWRQLQQYVFDSAPGKPHQRGLAHHYQTRMTSKLDGSTLVFYR